MPNIKKEKIFLLLDESTRGGSRKGNSLTSLRSVVVFERMIDHIGSETTAKSTHKGNQQ